jgi:hypothetical protein
VVPEEPGGALPQKGEIEVFASKAGHVTSWHLDFMEVRGNGPRQLTSPN